ncbi:GGDEF domain-containing protein [Gordonia spumicola]|uniref:GGDEF domain-containing protein n=1 Tax=Gordonia spumicola TaxID=589161 RepID=A0A7I9V563_9ACTN|nr:GGDEF domain-containing protein [Gordonia spumicola]GEE00555.1 GGDEF domain-containing protein [Gordonia spumicola]
MLDSTTLWAAIAAAAVVIGAVQVMQYLLRRDEPSMLFWGGAKLVGAVGAGLMAARGAIPDVVSVTVANSLIALAATYNAAGTIRFNGWRIPPAVIALPPTITAVAYLATPGIYGDIAAQTYVNGVCVVVVLSAAAIHAHRVNRTDPLVWRTGLAIALWLWVTTMVCRMTVSVWDHDATDPQGSSTLQSITAVMLMILVVMVGSMEMLASLERSTGRLADLALHDAQTGTLNRVGMDARLKPLIEFDTTVAIMLMDVDDFKSVNDVFGHPAGDEVLRSFVTIVHRLLRPDDILARYGGDEFCAVLPNVTIDELSALACDIRADFARDFDGVTTAIQCSVSVGAVANVPTGTVAFDDAFAVADGALYAAKKSGREEIRVFTDSSRPSKPPRE